MKRFIRILAVLLAAAVPFAALAFTLSNLEQAKEAVDRLSYEELAEIREYIDGKLGQSVTRSSIASSSETTYILNKNTDVFHRPGCKSVERMAEKNRVVFSGTREEAIEAGYKPCTNCEP